MGETTRHSCFIDELYRTRNVIYHITCDGSFSLQVAAKRPSNPPFYDRPSLAHILLDMEIETAIIIILVFIVLHTMNLTGLQG